MNFNKLLPQEISDLWDEIRYGVLESVYPKEEPNSETIQDILFKLLSEEAQCWCVSDKDGKYGYIITKIEGFSKKELLVYSFSLPRTLPSKEAFEEIHDKLESFAKGNYCKRIVAFSANENAISLAEKFGYSSQCRYLIKEL